MDDGTRSPNAGRGRGNSGGSAAEFAGIGVQFGFTIILFVFGGVWLDRRLDSSPWFVLIGLAIGAGGGFYSIYRKVAAAQRREAEQRAERRRESAK